MGHIQPEPVIASGLAKLNIEGKRVLAIIPDTTRTAPVGRKAGLGYTDPKDIDFSQFQGREDEGILFVEKAGETLFLLENGDVGSGLHG